MIAYCSAAINERGKDGYFAFCPECQGYYTSGMSYEEARASLDYASRLHVEE